MLDCRAFYAAATASFTLVIAAATTGAGAGAWLAVATRHGYSPTV